MGAFISVAGVVVFMAMYFFSRCPYCHSPLDPFRLFPYAVCSYCGNELDDKDQ